MEAISEKCRQRKFKEICEMAGLFESSKRKIESEWDGKSEGEPRKTRNTRKEAGMVGFGGMCGMGFPTLPQVSFPGKDVCFANCDAWVFSGNCVGRKQEQCVFL